jgi:hypothetical protein
MTPSQLTYTGVLLAVLANQLCLPVPAIVFLALRRNSWDVPELLNLG